MSITPNKEYILPEASNRNMWITHVTSNFLAAIWPSKERGGIFNVLFNPTYPPKLPFQHIINIKIYWDVLLFLYCLCNSVCFLHISDLKPPPPPPPLSYQLPCIGPHVSGDSDPYVHFRYVYLPPPGLLVAYWPYEWHPNYYRKDVTGIRVLDHRAEEWTSWTHRQQASKSFFLWHKSK